MRALWNFRVERGDRALLSPPLASSQHTLTGASLNTVTSAVAE